MKKLNTLQICTLGFAAALNFICAAIALLFHLPIYLDSIGTIFAGVLLGPVYGMITGFISGIISGTLTDVYAFYYLPVQLITGLLAGLLLGHLFGSFQKAWRIFLATACISLPGTIVSSAITAFAFGGITSSGSTLFVQLLHSMGLNLTVSVCLVQAITDFADRGVSILIVGAILALLPAAFKISIKKGSHAHGSL